MNGIVNVLAVVPAADFEASSDWYARFLGRPADRKPMEGCSEWQLATGGAIQLIHAAGHAGNTQLTLAVEDVDACAAQIAERGLAVADPTDVPSGRFRLTSVTDPDGNSLVLAQEL